MNRRGLLIRTIKACTGYFDLIRVVDGGSNDDTIAVAEKLGCEVFKNDWKDDVSAQYNYLLNKCKQGEWALFIDDDEQPSGGLLVNMFVEIAIADEKSATHIAVPMMVVQDGIPQQNIIEFIQQCDGEGFGDSGKFYSRRFFKICNGMKFEGVTHCGLPDTFMTKPSISRYPIYHYKDIDGWIVGDLWPVFINPEGHGVECGDELKQLCKENKIKTSCDVISVFKKGEINDKFKRFLWENKWPDGALAHWWMIYFLKYHPEQLPDDFCFISDDTSRRYLTYMKGHSHDLPAKRMCIHPIIKRYLLDKGVEIWRE